MVEIDEHHDACLSRDAGERDEIDGNGNAHVVAEPPQKLGTADKRKGTESMTISVSVSLLRIPVDGDHPIRLIPIMYSVDRDHRFR